MDAQTLDVRPAVTEAEPKLVVIDREGRRHVLDAIAGWRVMEIIREHGLPIKAECGGACACATCHVYVDPAWAGRIAPPHGEEIEMLDSAFAVGPDSRLSCQIIYADALDGLTVTLAPDDS